MSFYDQDDDIEDGEFYEVDDQKFHEISTPLTQRTSPFVSLYRTVRDFITRHIS